MSKKILFLINTAAFSKYFIKIALHLKSKDYDVVIATDSLFTYKLFKLDTINKTIPVEIFNPNIVTDISRINDSWAIYPDFDRGNYFGFADNFKGKQSLQILNQLHHFFSKIQNKYGLDYVFYENLSNAFAITAQQVFQQNNKKYLGLTVSRLPNRCYFSSDDRQFSLELQKKMLENNTLFNKESKEYINKINTIEPDYMKTNGLNNISLKPFLKGIDKHTLFCMLRYGLSKKYSSFQSGIPLINAIKYRFRSFKRIITHKRIQSFFSDLPQLENDTKYYIYPLHYHPESSTSWLARYYEEYNVIKNIAFSLKNKEILLIKDHKSAHGFESFKFYKKLSLLPNVILLKPNINAKQLIEKTNGVITLTSTVGYEAILKTKKVVVFGDVFYDFHPLVKKISSFSQIRESIDYLNIEIDATENNKYSDYNQQFIAAYMAISFPFTLDLRDKNTNKGIEYLANQLINHMNYC